MQYEGQVALVTGAASPIGQAISKRLAAGGARLILADVDEEALEKFAASLTVDHITMVGDLSQESVVDELVAKAKAAFQRIDILVNNAGGGVIMLTPDHTSESVKRTIDRNLYTACITLPKAVFMRW